MTQVVSPSSPINPPKITTLGKGITHLTKWLDTTFITSASTRNLYPLKLKFVINHRILTIFLNGQNPDYILFKVITTNGYSTILNVMIKPTLVFGDLVNIIQVISITKKNVITH